MALIISSADNGSIAQKKGLRAGDALLKINSEPVEDYIDYVFLLHQKKLWLTVKTAAGKRRYVHVRKREEEDLGIAFSSSGLEKIHACHNRCAFCFVDQMPRGMRASLYVKDDDWRRSVLNGSYITLTNTTVSDLTRIIHRKAMPLYISVHATDDEVRARMMGTHKAKGILPLLQMLAGKGIVMHTQVVLCPGINDGAVLQKTMEDLYALHPAVRTLAVVPVGLTAHRNALPPIRRVDEAAARQALDAIEAFGDRAFAEKKERFVFASDEFYLAAGRPLPPAVHYENFAQLENGVGMCSKFLDELEDALDDFQQLAYQRFSVVTGKSFAPLLSKIAKRLDFIYNVSIRVHAVENSVLGSSVTVAGLLCGADVARALKGQELGECVLLPACMFQAQGGVTLDGMTAEDVAREAGAPVRVAPCEAYEFIESIAVK